MLSAILEPVIQGLEDLAGVVPLPVFAFSASFIEELIAPIPSPIAMTLSGSLAASQHEPMIIIGWLALVAAVGKTIGSYLIYIAADKAEDLIMNKFGKFVGVSHKEVETIGKYLNKGWRDDIVLFVLRALPFVPTAPVSLVAGLIKLNLRTYLVSSFLGTIVRNLFYLYVGYTSLEALESINEGFDSFETFGYLLLLGLFGVAALYIYKQKQKSDGFGFLERFGKGKDE